MQIPMTFMDGIVAEIVTECDHIVPPLSADEIARHVLDALCDALQPAVYASLERLAVRGVLHRDRTAGPVLRYRLPTRAERGAEPSNASLAS